MGVARGQRIRSGADFRAIYAGRRMLRNRNLTIYWRPTDARSSRIGLSVGRRVGDAVRRNRCKRVLREVFRMHGDAIPAKVDLVFIPRPIADAFQTKAMRSSFLHLMDQLGKALKQGGAM